MLNRRAFIKTVSGIVAIIFGKQALPEPVPTGPTALVSEPWLQNITQYVQPKAVYMRLVDTTGKALSPAQKVEFNPVLGGSISNANELVFPVLNDSRLGGLDLFEYDPKHKTEMLIYHEAFAPQINPGESWTETFNFNAEYDDDAVDDTGLFDPDDVASDDISLTVADDLGSDLTNEVSGAGYTRVPANAKYVQEVGKDETVVLPSGAFNITIT